MSEPVEQGAFRFAGGKTVEGPVRCSVDGARITPCVPLASVCEAESRYERAVVHFGPMVSLTRGGERDGIVVELHRGGFMPLRFCPLCGVELATVSDGSG
jgi:hypothetical protein